MILPTVAHGQARSNSVLRCRMEYEPWPLQEAHGVLLSCIKIADCSLVTDCESRFAEFRMAGQMRFEVSRRRADGHDGAFSYDETDALTSGVGEDSMPL